MNKIIRGLVKWIVFIVVVFGIYLIGTSNMQEKYIVQDIQIVQVTQDTNTVKKESIRKQESNSRQMEQRTNNEELKKQLNSIKKDSIH